jgi:DNA polymerase elongation subunit (family B)
MNKEELSIRTASILRLQLEYDQLIIKAEFLQTLIVKERFALESINNPTIEEHLGVDVVAVDNTPPQPQTQKRKQVAVESEETLEGVKDCLKQLSIKTNSRKISLEILRKFNVEKTVDLDPRDYGRVCRMAVEALNEMLKAKKNDN